MNLLKIGFFFTIFAIILSPVFADETTDKIQQQINEYTNKITELSKTKDTLANQIKILDGQVQLTLLKINQTQASILNLEKDIGQLSIKIGDLNTQLDRLSGLYIDQVTQNYKLAKRIPGVSLLAGTLNFNQFLEQYKYLSIIQKNNQDSLISMETVRFEFDTEKANKEKKQEELEVLQKKLSEQQTNLARQKANKAGLLTITKNDEAKYQSLKKAAEAELSSLLAAKFVGKREVKKGEAIGIMGNTGYSFGDHLHFGLYNLSESDVASWKYVNDTDPSDYIKNNIWPMNDPRTITQGRGNTPYSYLYSDRFHHGIDMVSTNKTVVSVNDGIAYFYRNAGSSLGNHVKIFHADGKMTLYLHLQ